jgi:hypothetical protein
MLYICKHDRIINAWNLLIDVLTKQVDQLEFFYILFIYILLFFLIKVVTLAALNYLNYISSNLFHLLIFVPCKLLPDLVLSLCQPTSQDSSY